MNGRCAHNTFAFEITCYSKETINVYNAPNNIFLKKMCYSYNSFILRKYILIYSK